MDSRNSSSGTRKGESPHNLSVNADIFREWRTPQAEELELSKWTLKMLESAIALDYEQYGALKTAVHGGVPDALKPYVWIKANEADKFYQEHPNFYETCLESTFGNHLPSVLNEQCPTFCGGLMGFERDLHEQSNEFGSIDMIGYEFDPKNNKHVNMTDKLDDKKAYSSFSESKCATPFSISTYLPENTRSSPVNASENTLGKTDDASLNYYKCNPSESSSIKFARLNDSDKIMPDDATFPISENEKVIQVPRNVFKMKGPERMREMSIIFAGRESSTSKVYRNPFIKFLFKSCRKKSNLIDIDQKHLSEPLVEIYGKYNLPPLARHLSHLKHKRTDNFNIKKQNRGRYNRRNNSVAKSEYGHDNTYYSSFSEYENEDIKKILWFNKLGKINFNKNIMENKSNRFGNFLKRFFKSFCCRTDNVNLNLVLDKIDEKVGGCDRENFTYTNRSLIETSNNKIDLFSSPVPSALSSAPTPGQQQFLQLVATREKVQQNITTSVYNLHDVTDFCILLTPLGIEQIKRILWCLNTNFSSKVEYMPMLPTLCCVLLVYLIPEVVLCVLYKLLKRATTKSSYLFTACSRVEFIDLVKTCYSKAKDFVGSAVSQLEKLQVDLLAWISRVIQRGFTFILPFDHILRILGAYLFQGDEILCRYILSILKLLQPDLLKCNDKESAEQVLYYAGLRSNPNLDEITKIAYSFRMELTKYESSRKLDFTHQTSYLNPIGIKLFYRPRLNQLSSIINVHEWEQLWTWMNDSYRILDPEILYSSNNDGYNIISLVKKIETLAVNSTPALLFIQTFALDVIGAFIPQLCKYPEKGMYTNNIFDNESFLFSCKPAFQVYPWEGKGFGPKISLDCIKIGSDDIAIYIDKNLHSGHSGPCTTYNSPSLVKDYSGHFYISVVELWILS